MLVDTFSDFVSAAAEYADPMNILHRHQRVGQRAYNLLFRVRPDLAQMIAGSDFDPFYKDTNLPLFYDFLMRHWDDDKD